jgi:hypothetical protein
MLEQFEELGLTESNFQRWKCTHCPIREFRCEHCLHCVPGIAEAFRHAATLEDFLAVSEQVIAHASERTVAGAETHPSRLFPKARL